MTRSGFASCSALAILLVASAAQSVELAVTRYDDPPPDGCLSDDCSLREAVIAANSTADLDVILLSAGTYELSIPNASGDEDQAATGDLDFLEPAHVFGAAASMTAIDANGLDRVVHNLAPGMSGSGVTAFVGITFRGGNAPTTPGMLLEGRTVIVDCEVRDNGEPGFDFPAVRVAPGAERVEVVDTTIAANHGGGLSAGGQLVVAENATISDNAFSELRVDGQGLVACQHCTIVGGPAQGPAQVLVDGGELRIANSIVDGDCLTLNGGFIDSFGGNLESTGSTCDLDQADDEDDVPSFQLLLGPLTDNGGTTRTHLPGAASHAVDAANEKLCSSLDQRGVERPAAECDRGAVERSTERPETPIFIDGFEQGSAGAWSPPS